MVRGFSRPFSRGWVDDPPVTDRALPSWGGRSSGDGSCVAFLVWTRNRWSRERGGAMGGARGGAPPYKRTDTRRGARSVLGSQQLSSRCFLLLLVARSSPSSWPSSGFRLPRWLWWMHGREMRQCRWCGGPARWARSAGEGSRATRGVGARCDHADGRGRENSTDPQGSRDSFIFFGVLCK